MKSISARRRKQRLASFEQLENRQLLAADVLQLTIENLAPTGGLAQTPFWIAAHDGNFDVASLNEPASAFGGLEELAEEGDVSVLAARFAAAGVGNDAVITAPDGFAGAPVFEPGEVVSQDVSIDDTQLSRYFSFASMVIPSNDAFVANLNPMAYEIYDAGGNFLGPQSIVIYGNDVWDAGTEVNDPSGGAAFSTEGGTSVDENGVILAHPGLYDFVGTGIPTGGNLESAFSEFTPIARITISQASAPSGPIDTAPPKVEFAGVDLNSRTPTHEVQVVYHDASGVDITSIDTNDIRVIGPALIELDVVGVSTDAAPGTTPRSVVATYQVKPADSDFTHIHNGQYRVSLQDGAVRDVFSQATPAEILGDFQVDIPVRLQVTIESLGDAGGLGQTPFWIAAHDGNFEVGRLGVSASQFGGLEEIAEGGDIGPLAARFAAESDGDDAIITAPDGFAGAPVFEPGETVSGFLDVAAPNRSRFFSFASMIIPSNDAFLANLNPRMYEIFDRFGDFAGPQTITIYGTDIWDAGTEVNDPNGGAAFSTAGGTSVDENGVITQHTGLDDFIGTGLPTGENLASGFESITPIARISISLVDAPAEAEDNKGPEALVSAGDVGAAGTEYHDIEVTYADPSGINLGSIDAGDLEVVSNFAGALNVISVTTDAAAGSSPRNVTATYRLAPADGSDFTTIHNGIYNIVVRDGAVSDTLGNGAAESRLGDFNVLVGVQLQITVENLSGPNGLGQTPFWVGFHEGSFQTARLGRPASEYPGLEALAEGGDVAGVRAQFAADSDGTDGVVLAPGGFAGAPVFEPGEIASATFEIFNTDLNRYFSFASMIIPSNDAFLANLNPRAYELFNADGFFTGPRSITLYGEDIWDSGTEVNDPLGGAAFTTAGGTSVDEDGVVSAHRGLDDFLGSGLPTGNNLERAFRGRTPVARITIGLADNPSSPFDMSGPIGYVSAVTDVEQVGATSHEIEVTYNDPSGLDLTRFGNDDLIITGPLGQQLQVTSTSIETGAGAAPTSVAVTYTVTTADAQFTARNNGRYEVALAADTVGDTLSMGNELQTVGEFTVDVGIRIQVEIELLTLAGGLAQTPFWIGVHEGNFELGRAGVAAGGFGGLELIAEEGDPSEIVGRFAAESGGIDTVITAPDGFPGAPVFEPGEVASQVIEVTDTNINRYFSFASMVIPSNDAFIANLDPRQFALFDAQGNFQGAREITIYGRDVYDAGTEVNNPTGGAAFSTEGGVGVDENGLVRQHAGLDDFIGTGLPTGQSLASAFNADTPLARLTITMIDPEASACSGVIGACSVRSVSLHNPDLAFDVNSDGNVSAIDALLVINFLNRFGASATASDEARTSGFMLDVSDDANVSAIDALLVINRLNNIGAGEGEAITERGFTAEDAGDSGLQLSAIDQAMVSIPFDSFFDAMDDDEEDQLLSTLAG